MKFGIIGINGRMGQEIKNLFQEYGSNIVFSFDKDGENKTDKPDILIDFSLPEVFEKTLEFTLKMKVPLIIGTTGLSDDQLRKLREISSEVPVVQSYNFSIGIQMLLKATEMLNDNLPDWDVEISETHHRFKKDKPSGTAIMIQNIFDKNVNTSALRLGNVAGDHSVSFGSLGEIVTVSHRALSRRTFAEGVYKSAQFLKHKTNGLYTFKEVIFSK